MAPRMVYFGIIYLLWSILSLKNTKILTRESNWHKRKVKEAIYIR